MANNNLTNAAKKIAEALNAIAISDKTKDGKMAKLEQAKLLELIGDKKRLDNIDKQEADAKKEYARIVGSAKDEAQRLIRIANDSIKSKVEDLEKKRRELADWQGALNKHKEALDKKERELDGVALVITQRETAAKAYDGAVQVRENLVIVRERDATQREAIIKEYNDWQSQNPVRKPV